MRILIDADACPVTALAAAIAEKQQIPVILFCDLNHELHLSGAEIVRVDPGTDAADLALANRCAAGDVVITQDYGVAALALGRHAFAIHPGGLRFTDENIGGLLAERYEAKKQRRASARNHLKGPAKRTPEDDRRFEQAFRQVIADGLHFAALQAQNKHA